MSQIVNLTPHAIQLLGPEDEEILKLFPAGEVARVEMDEEITGELEVAGLSIPTVRVRPGEVIGLPAPQRGVRYVVSNVVAAAVADHREDVLCPYDLVRDDQGRVIGCRAFSRP